MMNIVLVMNVGELRCPEMFIGMKKMAASTHGGSSEMHGGKGWIERVVAAGLCICETPATDNGGIWLMMVTVMWVAVM
ncbi:hypothetical protein HanHA300_Chr02g0067971 [Helianthus annuus]|nr:hypothetical protein HanHA300_Chr02g0067971 [Helianthus annuus]KAJ0619881.1 hypothetical protein HanHA89_Chr02g0076221 [Helianthus annuus]